MSKKSQPPPKPAPKPAVAPPPHTKYPRASSFYAYSNCPASFALSQRSGEEPPTPFSDRGTEVHRIISTQISSDDQELLEEAQRLEKQRVEFFNQTFEGLDYGTPTREKRLWLRVGLKPLYSGAPDIYAVRSNVAALSDYKTSWHPLDEYVATNSQIRAYVGLVYAESRMAIDRLVAAIHKPGKQLMPAVFDKKALADALDWSIAVAQTAINGLSTKPVPVLGDWCKYCSGKTLCPLWKKNLLTISGMVEAPLGDIPDSQLRELAPQLPVAKDVVERLLARLEDRVRQRPDFFTDWKLVPGDSRRKISDAIEAYNILCVRNKHLSAGEFLSACRIGITELETRLRKKLAITAAATQTLMATLLSSIMDTKPNKEKLLYDPQPKTIDNE